jgi:hypothetical protein
MMENNRVGVIAALHPSNDLSQKRRDKKERVSLISTTKGRRDKKERAALVSIPQSGRERKGGARQ